METILSTVCAIITIVYFIVVLVTMLGIERRTEDLVKELRAIRDDFQAYKRANNIIS